ncbi:hypothetical protein WJX74_009851 [Apatococcus lobatus]|uniref:J domain-containing protein n=1 Tax=Apatococcus lobatus TaxID=904363 RepID=A0AAW1QTE2_9CHLO
MRGLRTSLCILLLSFVVAPALAGKDYYEILQIPRGADDQVIKRSYKKLALQNHPDKVSGGKQEKEKAAKRFSEISAAYEVLSDKEKRGIYDRYGEEGLKQSGGGGGGGPGDIFSQFFGGGGGPFGGFGGFGFGGGEEEEEQIPKGADVYVELEVTLRDLYLGNTFKVKRDKNVVKPGKGKRQCNCKNKVVTRQLGPGMFQQYTTQECETCQAVKLEREAVTLSVNVDPGMQERQEVTFFEEGEPMIDGEAGDLKFVLKTAPDARFQRQGNDLRLNATISLTDALVGFSTEVEHLDGHKIRLQASEVTIPGQVQVISGQGMPLPDQARKFGDLFVTYTVAFPKRLSSAQQTAVQDVFKGLMHEEL